MSTHLFIATAYLEGLPQATKWVLAAIADSADEHTLESAPGLPKLRAWSGLGKSQTLAAVATLKGLGFVEQLAPGRRGQRAVFRVFPAGVPRIPHPDEIAARYETGSGAPDPNPIIHNGDNPESYPQIDTRKGPADATLTRRKGPADPELGSGSYRTPSCTTSVLGSDLAAKPPAPRVDNPPPARPSTASGFPGARRPDDDADGIRRRARGANNRPCPVADHGRLGEIAGGCGRCAHAAATSDPETVAALRKQTRQAIARNSRVNPTTEETPA